MKEASRPRPFALPILALALSLLGAAASAGASRVVAVGDVHGSLDSLVAILRSAGLIDGDDRWIGGTATLVQTGDLVDRGAQVREVLDLVMRLEQEASAAGGRVIALLGNHELFNLVGYYGGDTTSHQEFAAIVAAFADGESGKRRKRAASEWNAWHRRHPECSWGSKRAWLDAHPEGYLEYVAALSPEGRYGAWLRERQVVARVGDTIFLHGGLAPDPPAPWHASTIEAINAQVAAEIEQFDADRRSLVAEGVALPFSELGDLLCAIDRESEAVATSPEPALAARGRRLREIHDRLPVASPWLAFDAEGPLWLRDYASWSDEEGAAQIARVAASYGAQRFVVGHTPQTRGIVARFDDRVFLIDTAMVFGAAAGGRPAALEIDGGTARALYEGGRAEEPQTGTAAAEEEPAPVPVASPAATVWLGPDDEPLPLASDLEVIDFLRQARVTSVAAIPIGVSQPKRLMLERGTVRSKAVFRYQDVTEQRRRLSTGEFVMFFRDSFINEVAAYELGQLLGMDNIPPAVERAIEDQPGSVQMWVENAMMESQRRQEGIMPPDPARFRRQFWEMRVFDNLINNTDRNQGNILFDPSWKLWLIDHTRSFARSKNLPAPKEVLGCSRSFFNRLKDLDETQVAERLGPYLSQLEIEALLARRERLVALLEQRIAERGEDNVLFNYGDPDPAVQVSYEEIEIPEG
ncbi:MAG: metallophosphoesterase [Acidobacteriota bacterium]|nr:metallophosphoesterase [Acidobacteriota bacterium]